MLPERASAAATVTAIDSMPKYIRTILELYAVCVRANGQKYAYRPTGMSVSTEACVWRFECWKKHENHKSMLINIRISVVAKAYKVWAI